MKYFVFIPIFFCSLINAQHTFSIVAVDPTTGEVGGAGATCFETVNDIADVHPGLGFIHTQSYVNNTNQLLAKELMNLGFSPQEIMDTLALPIVDAQGAPSYRQYAAVDLVNGGRAAAFSGSDCFDFKGHRVGPNYAIAGNILLAPYILDSMESRFLSTSGTLSDKLMAALQGAKVVGADKRCIDSLVSSISAYMIVAKPSDIAPNFHVNLNVENVWPQDPIDVLQSNYDLISDVIFQEQGRINLYPNPSYGKITFQSPQEIDRIDFYNLLSQTINTINNPNTNSDIHLEEKGLYIYQITHKNHKISTGKLLIH